MPSLEGVHAKLARAEKHLKVAKRLVEWFGRNKCRVEREIDPETGYESVFVRLPAPPPAIGLAMGDAIHCMRSALDYLVFQLVLSNASFPTIRTMFPVKDTREGFLREANEGRRLQGVPQAAVTIIDGLQPYHRRNLTPDHTRHFLWILNELENIDKHRRLTLTPGMICESSLSLAFPDLAPSASVQIDGRKMMVYDGAKLFGYTPPPPQLGKMQVKGTIFTTVVINEPNAGLQNRDAVGDLLWVLKLINREIVPKFIRFF